MEKYEQVWLELRQSELYRPQKFRKILMIRNNSEIRASFEVDYESITSRGLDLRVFCATNHSTLLDVLLSELCQKHSKSGIPAPNSLKNQLKSAPKESKLSENCEIFKLKSLFQSGRIIFCVLTKFKSEPFYRLFTLQSNFLDEKYQSEGDGYQVEVVGCLEVKMREKTLNYMMKWEENFIVIRYAGSDFYDVILVEDVGRRVVFLDNVYYFQDVGYASKGDRSRAEMIYFEGEDMMMNVYDLGRGGANGLV